MASANVKLNLELTEEGKALLQEIKDTAEKAGRRHSASDQADIQTLHEIAVRQGAVCAEPEAAPMKAGGIPDAAETPVIFGAVKAAGDWELDILANPYGGPDNGRDTDGQYFSPRTKFHEDQIPNPPAVYYHGYGDDRRPMGLPEWIGKAVSRWVDSRGVWYRVTLNRASAYAKRVWEAAQRGTARASTGVVLASHRVDQRTGEILSWLNGEISVFETDSGKQPANGYAVALPAMKAVYLQAGIPLPEFAPPATPQTDTTGARGPVAVARSTYPSPTPTGALKMDAEMIAAAAEADRQAVAAEAAAKAAQQAQINEIYAAAARAARAERDAEIAALKAENVANRRLPLAGGTPDAPAQAPHQTQFHGTRKFDGLNAADMGFMLTLLGTMKKKDPLHAGFSPDALHAYAIKLAEDKTVIKRFDGASPVEVPLGDQGRAALKAVNIDPMAVLNGVMKANELNHSTQASFGDDWIGVEYSARLWEAIRFMTWLLNRIPSVEVPQGAESIVISLESGDPTWYKVAQTTAEDSTDLRPVASVPSSKLGTANKTLTVAKIGARTQFSGELVEDSIIPWVAQLRRQMEVSGAQMLEHIVIDGDTDATNSTNINDIDGTPGATELFLTLNGFRKSALVTTTANSRSAGASLTDTDFLDTIKLMGTGGLNAIDKDKVEFIVDVNTYWKALTLASVKTRDVNTAATVENGELTRMWGYNLRRSGFMHYESAKRMAEATGKIDQTDSDNTTGAILAVRYDQWLFGYKRRFQIKLQEMIDSDSTQIVAFARVGMVQRDTEACAISYNVGLS